MDERLKQYLITYHGCTEEEAVRIGETASQEELKVLRDDMQFIEPLAQYAQEQEIRIREEREKAVRAAIREQRERRRKKKSQFALGFGIIPLVMCVMMLFNMVSDRIAEKNKPIDMEQAIHVVQGYLEMGTSQDQLVDLLEVEGYGKKDAEYIAENVQADWNQQAALAAQGHRDYKEMTDEELLDILIFQGFTEAQARYGVKHSK